MISLLLFTKKLFNKLSNSYTVMRKYFNTVFKNIFKNVFVNIFENKRIRADNFTIESSRLEVPLEVLIESNFSFCSLN